MMSVVAFSRRRIALREEVEDAERAGGMPPVACTLGIGERWSEDEREAAEGSMECADDEDGIEGEDGEKVRRSEGED